MVPALTRLLWPRPAAEALAKVKAANASASFRDLFLPGGRPPLPGLLSRRLDLAAVLDAVADQGISAFYGGNLTREMAAAVRNDFHHTHKVTLPQECNSWGGASGNERVASKIQSFQTPQFEVRGLMGLLCEQVDSQPLLQTQVCLFHPQVQASGGVVLEEDFANYSSVLQQPAEVTYQGTCVHFQDLISHTGQSESSLDNVKGFYIAHDFEKYAAALY